MSRPAAVVLLAAIILLPQNVDAQLTIKAGASFASASESELLPDISNRTGFALGVGFGFGSGVFALHTELMYVQKGGDLGDVGTLEIDELDVPLLAQFNLAILESLSPFLYAGPQAEFELSCTAADIDCVETESLRWGGVVGLGVRFAQRITTELRYNWTFNELSDDFNSKPRTILLLAGLAF